MGDHRLVTIRFSGRTYPQLAQIVRELCAVAGRWCLPLVAAVAVTIAVNTDAIVPYGQSVRNGERSLHWARVALDLANLALLASLTNQSLALIFRPCK